MSASADHNPTHECKRLPPGLVGTKCTARVIVADKEINCLLDTGSQVTTFPFSFYQDNFTNQTIQPLHNLLEIKGANGCQVPYLGFIETLIIFPKEYVGSDTEVQTLALIIPDGRPNAQVLIGTNTLNSLYSEYTSSKQ